MICTFSITSIFKIPVWTVVNWVAYKKLSCIFRIDRINFDYSAIQYGRIKGTLDIEKLRFQQYLKKLNVKHLVQITPKSF